MTHPVVLTEKATGQLEAAYQGYAERSPQAALNWYHGLVNALQSLRENPARCPLAREQAAFPIELRQLLYGSGRRKTHRVLFTIRPDRVVVYTIRHVAQAEITLEDL